MYNEIGQTTQTVYWIAHNNSNIVHRGILPSGANRVSSGQPFLESFTTEEEWLNRLTALGGNNTALTLDEKLSIRAYRHVSVPASYYDVNMNDIVSSLGLTGGQKEIVEANFAWWLDENGKTVPKSSPHAVTNITPTVRQYNEFHGILSNGKFKDVGILEELQDKNNPTNKYYLVSVPNMPFHTGETEIIWGLGKNQTPPNFTSYAEAEQALEHLELST